MPSIIVVVLIIACIGVIGSIAMLAAATPSDKISPGLFLDLDKVPTPQPAGYCGSCGLQDICTPRMQCWEAYKAAVQIYLNDPYFFDEKSAH